MLRRLSILSVLALALLGAAGSARAQTPAPFAAVATALGLGDDLAVDGEAFILPDGDAPQDGAQPGAGAVFPPIVDLQQGIVVRIPTDLASALAPCAGGPPIDGVTFGCPPALDPAVFAGGAFLFGTELGAPIGDGGLPANIGAAVLFAEPGATAFAGPWPFAGATGALRYVPGQGAQAFSIGPDGFSFVQEQEVPAVFVAVTGDAFLWTFVPADRASSFEGVQFHVFVDGSRIADTAPGAPGDATAIAPFDPAAVGLLGAPAEEAPPAPPPAPAPEPEPSPEPAPQPASDGGGSGGRNALGVGLVVAGAGAVVGGTVLVRRRWQPEVVIDLPAATIRTLRDELGGDAAAQAAWNAALADEAVLQQRLEQQYAGVATRWAQAHARFRAASAQYGTAYAAGLREAQVLDDLVDYWCGTIRPMAQAADLVYACATLAPAAARLGVRGGRRVLQLLRGADQTVTAARAAALEVVQRSPELRAMLDALNAEALERGLLYAPGDLLLDAVALADEAGTTVEAALQARAAWRAELTNAFEAARAAGATPPDVGINELVLSQVWIDLAQAVARVRGWEEATAATANVLTDLAVNARTLLRDGSLPLGQQVRLNEALTRFRALKAERGPSFYEWLGSLYEVIGTAASYDVTIAKVCTAEDVALLRWLDDATAAGHGLEDLPALWREAAGPIGAAGLDAMVGAQLTLRSADALLLDDAPAPSADLSGEYLAQFGILRPTFLGFEAGESVPLLFTYNVLNFAVSPVEWLFNAAATGTALYEYEQFLDSSAAEVRAISLAGVDVLAALEGVRDAAQLSSIDPAARAELREVPARLEAAAGSGTDAFAEEHAGELAARTAHIEQKLAQLDAASAALAQGAVYLEQATAALAEQVRGVGTVLATIAPDNLLAITQASMVVDAVGGSVLVAGAPAAPTTERPRYEAPWSPPPRGEGVGYGPPGEPWEGMYHTDEGTQAFRDSLTEEEFDRWHEWRREARRAEHEATNR